MTSRPRLSASGAGEPGQARRSARRRRAAAPAAGAAPLRRTRPDHLPDADADGGGDHGEEGRRVEEQRRPRSARRARARRRSRPAGCGRPARCPPAAWPAARRWPGAGPSTADRPAAPARSPGPRPAGSRRRWARAARSGTGVVVVAGRYVAVVVAGSVVVAVGTSPAAGRSPYPPERVRRRTGRVGSGRSYRSRSSSRSRRSRSSKRSRSSGRAARPRSSYGSAGYGSAYGRVRGSAYSSGPAAGRPVHWPARAPARARAAPPGAPAGPSREARRCRGRGGTSRTGDGAREPPHDARPRASPTSAMFLRLTAPTVGRFPAFTARWSGIVPSLLHPPPGRGGRCAAHPAAARGVGRACADELRDGSAVDPGTARGPPPGSAVGPARRSRTRGCRPVLRPRAARLPCA